MSRAALRLRAILLGHIHPLKHLTVDRQPPVTVLPPRSKIMLADPSHARSQMNCFQTSASEYVEDSEPEREQRRVKKKSFNRKKHAAAPIRPSQEVIELTDSEPSDLDDGILPPIPVAGARAKPLVVIEISDTSDFSVTHREGEDDLPVRNAGEANLSSEEEPLLAQDCTTGDSLPSIGKVFNLPKRTLRAPEAGRIPSAAPSEGNRPKFLPTHTYAPAPRSRSDSGGDDAPLQLARFAYSAPELVRRTLSKTPSPTERGSLPPEGQGAPKAKRTASHRFAGEFADSDLSRLLKCVSCDLAWTTRKTVLQKMKHIQTCSKKNGLTDDTVRTLLRNEIDKLPPVASSSKSATPAPPPSAPETLLEDILKDAGKKKPGRRPQVLQTVKSVTETRETILDKARTLLQNGGSSRAGSAALTSHNSEPGCEEMPPATQVFSRSSIAAARTAPVDVHQGVDTTLVFGPSRLAARTSRLDGAVVRTGAEIAAHSDVSPLTQMSHDDSAARNRASSVHAQDIPPSTQVFAPSKLTNVSGVARRVVPADAGPPEEHISIHDTLEDEFTKSSPPRPVKRKSSTFLAGGEPRRRRTSNTTLGPSTLQTGPVADMDVPVDDYDHHWNEWIHDVWDEDGGACLHYVPESEGAGPSRLPPAQDKPAPSQSRSRLAAIVEDAVAGPSAGLSMAANEPAPSQLPPKKRARRKKVAGEESDAEGKTADISQDELNAKMKEAILKDEALHLRILRYEPIHFDVFLQIAVDLGIPAKRSGLKGKVRAFLDQKAIHFYGADPSKSRTRRARHP
ncbi:hypothetical protein GY45DRAFT_1350736 [Cubamyces sp. BRFM 1775]|nr:hypothetical protein GY45DRAFT_1350736 [Cubamyces sp. BRFM 1775]